MIVRLRLLLESLDIVGFVRLEIDWLRTLRWKTVPVMQAGPRAFGHTRYLSDSSRILIRAQPQLSRIVTREPKGVLPRERRAEVARHASQMIVSPVPRSFK